MKMRSEISTDNSLKQTKPWLDAIGKKVSDVELKKLSVDWTPQIWEAFLLSTVEKEMSRLETTVDNYESLLEEQTETIWEIQGRVPEPVRKCVDGAIRKLPETQRKVIRATYFHEIPQTKIARFLKISPAAVTQTKNLSLNKIKDLIEFDLNVAAYLIGGSANLPLRTQTEKQELLQVYRADLNGSYMK